jgi:D-arabinono-1,4-lactone oxidase
VTHQIVSGFTATGSSGGSLQNTSNRNLHGFRVVDGTGEVHEFTREDADLDGFHSMMPSLGLLGVVTAITFECTDLFAIEGSEAVTTVEGGPEDVERFLKDAEFARLEWWPQRGAERMLTWQAARMQEIPEDFEPSPYKRFAGSPAAAEHAIAILFTILGNLDDLKAARRKLEDDFDEIRQGLEALKIAKDLGFVGHALAAFAATALEGSIDLAIIALGLVKDRVRDGIPDFYPKLIDAFIPLDKHGPQRFTDYGWSGLPMDNQASDALLPTEFTEAWVPLGRTREVLELLRTYFSDPDDAHECYRRTGTYAWELYAAMPAPFWLSPAHSSGADEWKDGALRIDPYWFADNAADPATTFFPGLWDLLRENDVPFRLHWGKFQPVYERGDRHWVDFFRAQYPRWDDFPARRAPRDPQGVFLTDYWRDRFGLWAP